MNPSWRARVSAPLTTAATSIGIVALAAVVGGLLIALSGRNPFQTFSAILVGAGLNFGAPGSAYGLQQTLVYFVPLVLLGFAVAIPFRAGLFNIGGQGQYFAGSFAALLVGTSIEGVPAWIHVPLAVIAGAVAAGMWAAIPGLLRAYLGTSEVIVTIMLNYIAIWIGSFLVGLGGPLQNSSQPTQPVSDKVSESAQIPTIWGNAALQGLHAGILLVPAIVALVWIFLNRTAAGFETRAVGYNPEASRYLGIRVPARSAMAMVLGGVVAGVAGAVDLLGWQHQISVSNLQVVTLGFVGIAVALLGRNTPIGVLVAAAFFAVLLSGSSSRNLDPSAFPPELAGYLTLIGQAVIILLVSLDASRGGHLLARLRSQFSRSPQEVS